MQKQRFNVVGFLEGIALGSIIGGVVALFAAPRSGTETRQMLMKEGEHIKEMAGQTLENTRDRMDTMISDTRQRADAMISDTRQRADEVLQRIGEQVGSHSNQDK